MVSIKPSGKTKRLTLKHKHKVEKKVSEHHRKARKFIKDYKLNAPHRAKNQTLEIRVPNACPFKREVVEEYIKNKKAKDAEKLMLRKLAYERRKAAVQVTRMEE